MSTLLIRSAITRAPALFQHHTLPPSLFSPRSQRYYSSSDDEGMSLENYRAISIHMNQLSKSYLAKKEITQRVLEDLTNTDDREYTLAKAPSFTRTTNMYSWEKSGPPSPLQLSPSGIPQLFNSDKEVLIKRFAALVQKQKIDLGEKIAIINEGCDNGDYMSLLVPFLYNLNHDTKISTFLINGNERKLKLAYRLCNLLLRSPSELYLTFMNAFFDPLPQEIHSLSQTQKLFLFFRLVIVERPEIIRLFIKNRLASMQRGDLGIASFLIADAVANETMSQHYKFSHVDDPIKGERLFTRRLSLRMQKHLQSEGIHGDLTQQTNAAFAPFAIKEMIIKSEGRVIDSLLIPNTSDEKHPINIYGIIFQKK